LRGRFHWQAARSSIIVRPAIQRVEQRQDVAGDHLKVLLGVPVRHASAAEAHKDVADAGFLQGIELLDRLVVVDPGKARSAASIPAVRVLPSPFRLDRATAAL
jgi:hypothetical protein